MGNGEIDPDRAESMRGLLHKLDRHPGQYITAASRAALHTDMIENNAFSYHGVEGGVEVKRPLREPELRKSIYQVAASHVSGKGSAMQKVDELYRLGTHALTEEGKRKLGLVVAKENSAAGSNESARGRKSKVTRKTKGAKAGPSSGAGADEPDADVEMTDDEPPIRAGGRRRQQADVHPNDAFEPESRTASPSSDEGSGYGGSGNKHNKAGIKSGTVKKAKVSGKSKKPTASPGRFATIEMPAEESDAPDAISGSKRKRGGEPTGSAKKTKPSGGIEERTGFATEVFTPLASVTARNEPVIITDSPSPPPNERREQVSKQGNAMIMPSQDTKENKDDRSLGDSTLSSVEEEVTEALKEEDRPATTAQSLTPQAVQDRQPGPASTKQQRSIDEIPDRQLVVGPLETEPTDDSRPTPRAEPTKHLPEHLPEHMPEQEPVLASPGRHLGSATEAFASARSSTGKPRPRKGPASTGTGAEDPIDGGMEGQQNTGTLATKRGAEEELNRSANPKKARSLMDPPSEQMRVAQTSNESGVMESERCRSDQDQGSKRKAHDEPTASNTATTQRTFQGATSQPTMTSQVSTSATSAKGKRPAADQSAEPQGEEQTIHHPFETQQNSLGLPAAHKPSFLIDKSLEGEAMVAALAEAQVRRNEYLDRTDPQQLNLLYLGDKEVRQHHSGVRYNFENLSCAYFLCLDPELDPLAEAEWCHTPGPELKALYQQLFGEYWQANAAKVVQLGRLNAMGLLQGCLGAAVQRMVYDQELPWNSAAKAVELMGPLGAYVTRCMVGEGSKRTFAELAWHGSRNMALDRAFHESTIRPEAERLAQAFSLVIHPQLLKLGIRKKGHEPGAQHYWAGCNQKLVSVFESALVLKGILSAAPDEHEFQWVANGAVVDKDIMEEIHPGAGTAEVLYCISPIVWVRQSPDEEWRASSLGVVQSQERS